MAFTPLRAEAARSMSALMSMLLEVFPEQRGWFVEGSLGVVASIPEGALSIFEQPRVIVPDVDGLQIAMGKLFAASGKLPIKKITRHDEKPGINGLPGFRGIWCKAEDETAVGFTILTPNQNRFLMWAKRGYFSALIVDSIPSKIRNWYARSVSEHLASIDYSVPDNPIPQAISRNLPSWMELYPPAPALAVTSDAKLNEFMAANSEIKIWGWGGLTAFIPSSSAIDRFVSSARDTLYDNKNAILYQEEIRGFIEAGGQAGAINALTKSGFDTLQSGSFIFAVDPYGRVRIAGDNAAARGDTAPRVNHAMLFPGSGVLSAGIMEIERLGEHAAIKMITTRAEHYFYSRLGPVLREDVVRTSESYLLSLGHLFTSLQGMGVTLDRVLIRKF